MEHFAPPSVDFLPFRNCSFTVYASFSDSRLVLGVVCHLCRMPPLQSRDQLDHYGSESLVAEGGMASIYRARDLHTGRPVAIKIPQFEAASDPVFFDPFAERRR